MLVALGACAKSKVDMPGQCLPVPSTMRFGLTASPSGDALYWFEPVTLRDFDAERRGYTNLVRFDLHTRQLATVADHAVKPALFTRDGIVVQRDIGEMRSLVLVEHDGALQSLLPDHLRPLDVEPVDDHTVAVLASGEARRAVYTLDLDQPRPKYIIDADILISVGGTTVFTGKDDDGVSIDLVSGKRRTFSLPPTLTPEGSDLWYVEDDKIHVRSMITDDDRSLFVQKRDWKLVLERGAVLARVSQRKGDSQAILLRDGGSTTLSDVRGGVSVLEATIIGERTWALIGHNSSNYDGDIGDTQAEADVCVIAPSGSTSFVTRSVPERYLDRSEALFASLKVLHPRALLQVMDGYGEPTTVLIEVPERGGADFEAMRRRARFFHERVTAILGDREVRTDLQYSDRRIAHVRWRRNRLETRATAGMGFALEADYASYPIELRQRALSKADKRITCAGTLVNLRPLPLLDVKIRCIAGDRTRVIEIGTLAPGAAQPFSQSYEVNDDDEPNLEISIQNDAVEYLDQLDEERDHKAFELGAAVYEATGLAIDEQDLSDDPLVTLTAPEDFAKKPEDVRFTAVANAYQRLQALRALYGYEDGAKMGLHIEVRRSTIAYDYDGEKLTLHD